MTLPTNLSGPQSSADNRDWHAEIRNKLPALNLPPVQEGLNGHLAHHAAINAHVNAQFGSNLPTNPQEDDPNHELHHNTIHSYINGLGSGGGGDSGAIATNATQEVHSVLSWLKARPSQSTRKWLSGQHVGFRGNYLSEYNGSITSINTQLGHWVGLLGYDLGSGLASYSGCQAMLNHAVARWNEGHIITIGIHAFNPVTNGDQHDMNINIADLVTPGTSTFNAWRSNLDQYALCLQHMKDANVPVLFKPFHEHTNSSFWWCSRQNTMTPDRYNLLWQQTFNYLNGTKGLNNLIWVFSAHANFNPYSVSSTVSGSSYSNKTRADWFPGNAYIDIHGLSTYSNDWMTNATTRQRIADQKAISSKPFAFTESGWINGNTSGNPGWDMAQFRNYLQDYQSNSIYWMAWSGRHSIHQATSPQTLMNDNRSAHRQHIGT